MGGRYAHQETTGLSDRGDRPLVIGASFPRTGTNSLKLALEYLGFGKCYHIQEMNERNELPLWDVPNADYEEWNIPERPPFAQILYGYGAGVDVPFCLFWKEMFDEFPDSKVVLSVRDPESWYTSCLNTIFKHDELPHYRKVAYERVPCLKALRDWEMKTHWGPWKFHDKDSAIAAYEAYMAEVQATIPPERLLVFSVKDGWGPLCEFLGVDAP